MVVFSFPSDCYLNDFIIKHGIDGMREKKVAEIRKLSGNWALRPQLTHPKHSNTFIELHPAKIHY